MLQLWFLCARKQGNEDKKQKNTKSKQKYTYISLNLRNNSNKTWWYLSETCLFLFFLTLNPDTQKMAHKERFLNKSRWKNFCQQSVWNGNTA